MRLMLFVGLVFLSSISFAQENVRVKTILSFDAQSAVFGEQVTGKQSFQIEYLLTPLSYEIKSSDFKFSPVFECKRWISQGTSPDDPGQCGDLQQTGWSVAPTAYDVFSVERVVTNLQTGSVSKTALSNVRMDLYEDTTVANPLKTSTLPSNLAFVGYLRGSSFGCGVTNTVPTELLGQTAQLGVCGNIFGKVTVVKNGGKFSFTSSSALTLDLSVTGFWLVTDAPRTDVIRKNIWSNYPNVQMVFSGN